LRQLNWILLAAMADYQPETAAGDWNPNSHPVFYKRCARMLQVSGVGRPKSPEGMMSFCILDQNIERCVVYGSPELTEVALVFSVCRILTVLQLEEMYVEGQVSAEVSSLSAKRR
jgi:hypothetical protein